MTEFDKSFEQGRLPGLPRWLGRLVHRPGTRLETQATDVPREPRRERNFERARALAQGPNRLAMELISTAAVLPLGSGQSGGVVDASVEPPVFLEGRRDTWKLWLAREGSGAHMQQQARMVASLGEIMFGEPHHPMMAKQFPVSALHVVCQAEENIQGYLQRPVTALQCFDAPFRRYHDMSPRSENRVDIAVNEEGQVVRSLLYLGGTRQPKKMHITANAVSTMLLEAVGSVQDVLAMRADIENITADNGDISG